MGRPGYALCPSKKGPIKKRLQNVLVQAQNNEMLWADLAHKLSDQVVIPLNTYQAQFPEMRVSRRAGKEGKLRRTYYAFLMDGRIFLEVNTFFVSRKRLTREDAN